MELKELCEKIDLPSEAKKAVLEISLNLPKTPLLKTITDPKTAKSSYLELKKLCSYESGFTMLAYMLTAALNTYDLYVKKSIDNKIFFDTMECFSRFVGEHKASFGCYGFDRAWWTYRQLSMTLFRIGELEYEFRDDEKTIHIHIPTRANIYLNSCRESYEVMQNFVREHYSDKSEYKMVLNSWLLSPALDKLLDSESNIIKFKNCFDIQSFDSEAKEFLQWVYGKMDIEYSNLPEYTSLQKNMKKFLLNGGTVGSAKGNLIKF